MKDGSFPCVPRVLSSRWWWGLTLIVGLVAPAHPTLGQSRGSVQPHWLANGRGFWYSEGGPDNRVIYLVDPVANTKEPLFDTERMRASLTAALGHEPPGEGLPFESFAFVDDQETAVEFAVGDEAFVLDLDTYSATAAPRASSEERRFVTPQVVKQWRWSWPDLLETHTPDGRWLLGIDSLDLRLRSTTDGRTVQLTSDGEEGFQWLLGFEGGVGSGLFSPDSRKLAVARADIRGVPRFPITYYLGATAGTEWVRGPKAGQPMPKLELFVMDIPSGQRVRIEMGEQREQRISFIEWLPDGSELLVRREDRIRSRVELLAADPSTGATRSILSEEGRAGFVTLVAGGEQFIWASERDGWNHLYLYDLDGTLIHRLTSGAYPVLAGAHMTVPERAVVGVDEAVGWVYVRAQGDPGRPYDVHFYRVRLDGSGSERLTDQPGFHDIRLSPSKEFYLDTHSSLDRPPRTELRRSDGTLLQTVSQARVETEAAEGWVPPEEFTVKAADGVTDLYGVLFRPRDFDPDKKYPVVEYIYAGPWTTIVPRRFDDFTVREAQWLAGMGAVVFIVDGRGTPGRGREFEDVVLGSLGRHEIPDHVATLQALARERPYMDTRRVGVFGGSWGGYFALRAMLLAPDIYHVGVAYAPASDPSEYWADYVEPYLGLPEDHPEAYEYASNIRLAENLAGELLLIHGTGDVEAPWAGTMRMADALIRAGKYFDLIALPDEDHFVFRGTSASYLREAVRRHFVRHLLPS